MELLILLIVLILRYLALETNNLNKWAVLLIIGQYYCYFSLCQKGLEVSADYEIVVEEGHLALETIKGLGAYPVLYGPLSSPEYFPLP